MKDNHTWTPALTARLSYPILNHPGIPLQCSRNYCKLLSSRSVTLVRDLVSHPKKSRGPATKQKVSDVLDWLTCTLWDPACPLPPHHHKDISIWPDTPDMQGCIHAFTAPQSIIAMHVHMRDTSGKFTMAPYQPHLACPPLPAQPPGNPGTIRLWTDGSALNNGLETCSTRSAWVSNLHIHTSVCLSCVPLSNNVAEVATVILALQSWPNCRLHIHADSRFMLKLIHSGLLSLKHDGWPDFPWLCQMTRPSAICLSTLYQHLLF